MAEIPSLYEKKITCTFCEHTFQTMKVRTRALKVKKIETDFCTIYEDESISPYLYFVNVCPKCGFSFTEQFSPYFTKESKDEIHEKIEMHWKSREFSSERSYDDAIITYKLALISAQTKHEPMIIIAGLYMRLAWLYRKLQDEEQEQRFLRLSLQSYEESYGNGDYSSKGMATIRLEYLIGEINFRLGKFQEALQFYNRVVSQEKQTTERALVKQARQQWRAVRTLMTGETFREEEDD